MKINTLQLVAQHAHQICELAKLEDLEDLAKRLEAGERNTLITSDEQARRMAALARATVRFVLECAEALK